MSSNNQHSVSQTFELDTFDESLLLGTDTSCTITGIARGLWGNLPKREPANDFEYNLKAYSTYCFEQIRLFCAERGKYVSVETYKDITMVSRYLIGDGLSSQQLKNKLQATPPINADRLDNSLNLVCRLIFMMCIGTAPNTIPGGVCLRWADSPATTSIKRFVADYFDSCKSVNGRESLSLNRLLTAQNISRIAGLKILWTDNLCDHLRLFNDDTELAIFHHASFLMVAKHAKIFPLDFAEETLRTLSLLLPKMNKSSRRWYLKLVKENGLDRTAHCCFPLHTEDRRMDKFSFWRERLEVLHQLFDEAEPSTWKQWWFDTRKGLYRWPFLVAVAALILTAFFGLVQSIEGAIQVWKAYNPS